MKSLQFKYDKQVEKLRRQITQLKSDQKDGARKFESTIKDISVELQKERRKALNFLEENLELKSRSLVPNEIPNVMYICDVFI